MLLVQFLSPSRVFLIFVLIITGMRSERNERSDRLVIFISRRNITPVFFYFLI